MKDYGILTNLSIIVSYVVMDFPGSSDGKESSVMQETCVQSLGLEDHLEKGMATYSSILAWRMPWTEESGELQSMGSQRVGHNWSNVTCKTSLPNIISSYYVVTMYLLKEIL